ncbi:MAG: hypothetical protein D6689_16180 [Deltaproteobacteria bacterium]|nr:MAG: hypothetical protein D6689_16180 [Deltaproteobacteria bacterium]
MTLVWWIALVVAAASGCGAAAGEGAADAGPADDLCAPPPGTEVFVDPEQPCRWLSSTRLFRGGSAAEPVPNDRVVPYDVNSPLFSDYADKRRYLYLPEEQAATYSADEAFALPVGAVLVKTFQYPQRVIETRLLVHAADGWRGYTYVWNDEQTDAELRVAGATFEIDGHPYLVPNANQCKECHEEVEDVLGPVGIKARHLNRDFDYGDGPVNQIAYLVDRGLLAGAPADLGDVPRAPVWDDPATGSVDERARAYLDINCAHCHNPSGRARTSGLDLRAANSDPYSYGVCKPPVAAGGGSGGLQYSIVPGAPDESILIYRVESVEPDVQMPELGRTRVHAEGVALLREWIAAMDGGCPGAR